jgi:hypothetical protein
MQKRKPFDMMYFKSGGIVCELLDGIKEAVCFLKYIIITE